MGTASHDMTQDTHGRLDAAGVLDLWDLASELAPAQRATAAVAVALPGRSRTELGELSLGARDRLLLGLLGADTTAVIEGVIDCEACAEPIELTISCAQLLGSPPPAQPEPFAYDGWRIRWRLPTGDDLAAAGQLDDDTDLPAFLLARCVLDVQGPTGPATVHDLPDTVRSRLIDTIDDWDPLTDIRLQAACPCCGAAQSVDLDVATLVWTEIATQATMLLHEVHTLARAYGWSQSEVLALSTRRRRAYVRLADA